MLQITPHMRIFLAVEPVDFRKGIDGLIGVCNELFCLDPFSGYVFVFFNKKRTSLKILVFDGQGFWLCLKRLSRGRFRRFVSPDGKQVHPLLAHELQIIVANGNPKEVHAAPAWRSIVS